MKVSLVVASGAHQGKVIQITGPQFLIGRDGQCHLRPASQAISKRHCGILVRDGQIYIQDFGSTNGTTVNDELIRSQEVLVVDGASLKLGPLDFTVRIEPSTPIVDGTPLPGNTPETAAALAAVKAATGSLAVPKSAITRDTTPNPAKPAKSNSGSGSKESAPLTGSKEAAALKAGGSKATPPKSSDSKPSVSKPVEPKPEAEPSLPTTRLITDADDDKMAAMLLGMEDEGVPEGSTVIDMPGIDSQGNPIPPKVEDKTPKKVVAQTREEMSSAASDLLRKMMRRPK